MYVELNPDSDPSAIGGKAAGLLTAITQGLNVPPSLVLPHSRRASMADDQWLEDASIAISEWATERKFQHLVVRSSAHLEDGSSSSFAGIYESRFSPASAQAIRSALAHIVNQAQSDRVSAYLAARGHRAMPGISVLVQPTVPPICSGIAFGSKTKDDDIRTVLQATWGLCVQLAAGITPGDSYDSEARPGEEIITNPKHLGVYPLGAEDDIVPGEFADVFANEHISTENPAKVVFIDEEQRLAYLRLTGMAMGASVLSPALFARLLSMVHSLVRNCGHDVDIEWVFGIDQRLWLVQSRPLTAPLPRAVRLSSSLPYTTGQVLLGEPGAPGIHTGPIQTWYASKNSAHTEGSVLLCAAAKPEMLSDLVTAGAVVSSDAGILCHIAILARELGKPCVLAVRDLPDWASDGTVVTVDGANGSVRMTHASAPKPGPTAIDTGQPLAVDFMLPPLHERRIGGSVFGRTVVSVVVNVLDPLDVRTLFEELGEWQQVLLLVLDVADHRFWSAFEETVPGYYRQMRSGPWLLLSMGLSESEVSLLVSDLGGTPCE